MSALYPVTVFTARYGGTYEGASWIAVQAHVDPIMDRVAVETSLHGCQSDDIECMSWYEARATLNLPTGRGDTPDEAVSDLARQLGEPWTPGDDSVRARFERAMRDGKKAREAEGE